MKVLRYIWAVYFLIWFITGFLLLYPLFRFYLAKEKRYPKAHKLRRIWGRGLMVVTGIVPKVTQETDALSDGPYVFVANHFSYLDIVTTNVLMPVYFSFMAKKELADIPLFSVFFRTIDISVDRSLHRASYQAFNQASEKIKKGISVMVFPEGGIGSEVPKMRAFKSGAFRLAIEHQIPIVPITIADNWKRLYSGGLEDGGTPGIMRMHVHRPIQTAHLKVEDAVELKSEVYRIIENQWIKMNPNYNLNP